MNPWMREGKATVYPGPPTWDPIETLVAYRFKSPRMFLVGRSLPMEPEPRMAVSYLHPDGQWTHDQGGMQPLGWEPLYVAEAPAFPPWPPPDHPSMRLQLCED